MWPFKKKKEYAKVGDIIKCIDDRDWNKSQQTISLICGNKYKVLNVVICPSCGCVTYDIGCRFINSKLYTNCNEGKDGHDLPGMGIHLAGDFRFEKTQETVEEIQEKIEEFVKEEKYEQAQQEKIKLDNLKT